METLNEWRKMEGREQRRERRSCDDRVLFIERIEQNCSGEGKYELRRGSTLILVICRPLALTLPDWEV
ncbi:hypothetical protein E2C01_022978 [Portunus trituberculatus]|uniref:Uncharacterized protein n=1 Tax=Portunus trituberculatus TaxID=210409 RepID=A0A5B7E6V0_PORTR|nr:hypothetical protein [Portunus trituberculatus]